MPIKSEGDPYAIGPDICPNCYGSGRVAIGPWGVNPAKGSCPECGGDGLNKEMKYD